MKWILRYATILHIKTLYIESYVNLSMTASAGEIYFTTDNTDPRATGGAIALSSAGLYTNPLKIEGTGVVKARAKQGNMWSALTEATFASTTPGGIVATNPELSVSVRAQAFPNPFNQYTYIEFQTPEACFVKAGIYGTDGRLITTLYNDIQSAGIHRLTWIPHGQSGGVYFYRLQLDKQILTGRLLLVK